MRFALFYHSLVSDWNHGNDDAEMKRHLHAVLTDEKLASALAAHGRATILARHTCAHRVDELMSILQELP